MVFHLHFLLTKSKFFFLLAGHRIEIYTNHFKINFCTSLNKIILYQFDVDVEILMFDPSCYSCEKDERLQVSRKIISEANLPLVWYDEGKNLYSQVECYELHKRSYFRPYTVVFVRIPRRYTIVIRSHVNRRISPYAVVYERTCSTWIHLKIYC